MSEHEEEITRDPFGLLWAYSRGKHETADVIPLFPPSAEGFVRYNGGAWERLTFTRATPESETP